MKKKWLGALAMAGALALSACAGGGASTNTAGGSDGEVVADADLG